MSRKILDFSAKLFFPYSETQEVCTNHSMLKKHNLKVNLKNKKTKFSEKFVSFENGKNMSRKIFNRNIYLTHTHTHALHFYKIIELYYI